MRHILFFLLALWVTGHTFSQNPQADSVYAKLDTFLEAASDGSAAELATYLEAVPPQNARVQLAKTIAYCNLGYFAAHNNHFQKAIYYYEQAKQLYFNNHLKGYDIIEYCLKPLGNLYIRTQALSEAENVITHYILLAQEQSQMRQEVGGILNLSVLYHNQGAYEKAIALLEQGLQKSPNNPALQLNLATNYFGVNKKGKARQLLHKVLSQTPKNSRALMLLAQLHLSETEYPQAIATLKKVLKILKNQPETNRRSLAKAHLALADTYQKSRNIHHARSELQQVYGLLIPSYSPSQEVPLQSQLYPETTLLDALVLQASIFRDGSHIDKAIGSLELAEIVQDYLIAQVHSQGSRLIAQQEVERRVETLLELYFIKYRNTQAEVWLEKALRADNRTKARVVADANFLRHKLLARDNAETSEFLQLEQRLAFLNDSIQREANAAQVDYAQLVRLQKEYSAGLTRQRLLYAELLGQGPLNSSLDLSSLQQKAKTLGENVVSYFIGSKAVYQIIIAPDGSQFKKLTSTEGEYLALTEAIRSYIHYFNHPETINRDIKAFSNTSHRLYALLQLPKAERLVVIPDGLLAFVPFQTLLTQTSQSFQYEKMPFLVFESALTGQTSFYNYLNETSPLPKNPSVLGMFPVFKGTPQELGYSVLEAHAIDDLFPSKLFMEEKAKAQTFIDNLDSHSIIHLSTHALGGTFGSDPFIKFSDRDLSLGQLYGLRFHNDLVVLSACETGVGKVVKGEGALSLARGFQFGGAPNVLFTLWQVNDKSTAQWMTYFYRNLKSSHSRNISVRQASLDYLRDQTIDNPHKSPYYWGAFVYYGNTDLAVEGRKDLWYALGIVALVAIGLFGWFYFKRKATP